MTYRGTCWYSHDKRTIQPVHDRMLLNPVTRTTHGVFRVQIARLAMSLLTHQFSLVSSADVSWLPNPFNDIQSSSGCVW
jgi:hypothetical protein